MRKEIPFFSRLFWNFRLLRPVLLSGVLVLFLCGCSLQRSHEAAVAKARMVGMSKEQVLTCMGPPKQKAHVNDTEVWSYRTALPIKTYCSVNVIMSNDIVTKIRYIGPSGGLFDSDEQCAYAIENCIGADE